MTIAEATQLLVAVDSAVQPLLPRLAGDPRNLKKAKDVSRVFKVYESGLRARSHADPIRTNSEGDIVRGIIKSAKQALDALNHFDENPSRVLDRAYDNGDTIEKQLRDFVDSLDSAVLLARRSTEARAQQSLPRNADEMRRVLGARAGSGS